MAEIKDSKLIRDALGSPVPQYWDETSQMYIARTVDGSFADVDFSKIRLLRDKLGSPIPQLWDTETAKFVPGKGGGNGEVTIESVPGLKEKLDTTTAQLAETEQKLSSKVGAGTLAKMADLDQEVKTGMTGGSVAVVGEGAVTMLNLANDVKTEVNKIALKETIKTSTKNMFDPTQVIEGQTYLDGGGVLNGTQYKATPKYPVVAGETISISGMEKLGQSPFANVHFWNGTNGSVLVSKTGLPPFPTTDYFTFTVPANVTHFTLNINQGTIPAKLQIEKAVKATSYQPYLLLERGITPKELTGEIFTKSSKNLYDGKVASKFRLLNIGFQGTSSDNDTVSSFVPVEFGKYYTLTGLDPTVIHRNILGYSSNFSNSVGNFVKFIGGYTGSKATIYIDDPNIKYVVFPVSNEGAGTYQDALSNSVQVEEGQIATPYEPMYYMDAVQKSIKASARTTENKLKAYQPDVINNYVELNKTRSTKSEVGTIAKDLSPLGISYAVAGDTAKDSQSNNLFAQYEAIKTETKQVYVNLANYIGSAATAGKLKATPFTVPSGQLDNPGTLDNWAAQFNTDDYCHPDIAYDATGVAGYKYWMLSSILPSGNKGDVVWEDEDVFVSNDAKTWMRIKSQYESAKTYHAPNLSLPPQTLVTVNARKHAFLPSPAKGDTIEISVPADNGATALDRVTITLTELPWKHDPAIFIDGGYVYTYHSFHLPYADRNGGKNRFIVCVRTNDGINWEVVRTDGSTMLLTEESSKTIFTKDEQGRYNYMYYAYNRGYNNPQVLKYGTGDYELAYGYNFTLRFKGTTPYNFDFSQSFPIQDVGSGNHPGLLLDGTNLYLLNNEAMFVSTNRGETFTKYSKYPAWLGGISGTSYKKTLCKGVGGKVILVEAQRQHANAPSKPLVNSFSANSDVHQLYIYEYASVTDLVNKAQNGLVDGYIDVQLSKVNFDGLKRSTRFYPYVSNSTSTSIVNRPLQRIKLADLQVEEGDTVFLYVTLNSRNGAKIMFGGVEIV